MTETAKQLRRIGRPHARARAGAALLASAGVALGIAAAGQWLAPRALAIGAAWLGIAAVAAFAVWAMWRAGRGAGPQIVGHLLETTSNARAGSVVGTLSPREGASAELFALADARAASAVTAAASQVDRILARDTRRRLVVSAIVVGGGAALFVAASPAAGRAAFWHPLRTIADARSPVRLALDRVSVRRGDTVTVTIIAPAATRAVLWTRGLGEPWRPTRLTLNSAGQSVRRLGPLQSDLYVRATSGIRRSEDRKVSVTLPAFLATLELTARFPTYLQRADEPLVPGADTVLVPAGTEVVTNGAASVPLAGAMWVGTGDRAIRLAVEGSHFKGPLACPRSGTWRLALTPTDGSNLEGDVPALHVRVVPDSAPVVSVPIPGRDTTLPVTLRQPLVIDARDDHGLARVELVSWRVSQTGKVGNTLRQALDVSGAGDRALLLGELDAEGRGLLPGDTLRFRVEVWDNAPTPHHGQSEEFALRLASMEELRAATRAEARDIGGSADSLAAAAANLSQRTSDLAEERPRDASAAGERAAGAQAGSLPFETSQRAEAIADQVADIQERARQLAQAVERVARIAQQAGLMDTAFQARLEEVRQLLQRALTPELAERLRELQQALARLDPDAARQALERLVDAQKELRETLERSRSLLQRAAAEGALESLAADAEELRKGQNEWNRAYTPRPDSMAAAHERRLAERTDSLAGGIARVMSDLARTGSVAKGDALNAPHAAAIRAQGAMQRAAVAAAAGRTAPDGEVAESALAQIPDELRAHRDAIARAWRQETLDALDRALSETAALAARQLAITDTLREGGSGAAVRSRQASVEEGALAVGRQIQAAADRHALVSPALERALGLAQRQMSAAREQLEMATPDVEAATTLAASSVDALNATAYALARTRGDVANARSGSGFAEAMDRLARIAGQQGGLNDQAQGLLPLAAGGGDGVLDQLRGLAARQRALAEQLEGLDAEGGSAAAGGLGRDARELARQMEAGHLDAQTIRRQDQLYHRLLDAGRTLSSSTPDEQLARVSHSATGDSVHIPAPLAPGASGTGPHLRYPGWDELAGLTPEQRRLVLEYFRRVNAPPLQR